MNYTRNSVVQFPVEGWHKATILGIKEGKPANTMVGVSPTALTTFKTDEGQLILHSFLMAEGVHYLLEDLINVTLGPGEGDINLEDLIDLRCGIRIEHFQGKDRMYANVVEVCLDEDLLDS